MAEKTLRIVVTGAESTGKSTIAKMLAKKYNGLYIPEYAREYTENLKRPYQETDLINIANKQIQQLTQNYSSEHQVIFFDTGLEITQVWFEEKYNHCPDFIKDTIPNLPIDLYIVCDTDLEWKNDKVRENGGTKREYLLKRYEQILRSNQLFYVKIKGFHKKREKYIEMLLNSAYHLQKDKC